MSNLPKRKNPDNHPWGLRGEYKPKKGEKISQAYRKAVMDYDGEAMLRDRLQKYESGKMIRESLPPARRMSKKAFKDFMAKAAAIDDDKPLKSYGIG